MMNKNNISAINNKNKCCGCSVCVDCCPKQAITMEEDNEGFLYPKVDQNKCINCGKCLKVCPIKNKKDDENKYNKPEAYAVKHKDEKIRKLSRSGGIFTAISDYVLSLDGAVYGAIMDEKFRCVHHRAINEDERNKMRGSKYVQSDMQGILGQINKDLAEGRWVLFTGTSCQVQAVRQAIPKKLHEKLILVDIVCHGVPSPKIWFDYLKYNEKKYNGKITEVNFRNKDKYGWAEHVETISVNHKEHDSRIYTNLFYNHVIIRPSCFECPYKCLVKSGNITIADCWGIDNAMEGFNDNKGVSLVLINDNVGKEVFDKIKVNVNYEKIDLQKCMQPPLKENFVKPIMRMKFWRIYRIKGFERAIRIYGEKRDLTIYDKIHRKIKKMSKKLRN